MGMHNPLLTIARLALFVGGGLLVTGVVAALLQQVETTPHVTTATAPYYVDGLPR